MNKFLFILFEHYVPELFKEKAPARRPFMILNRDSHGPANWTHPATAAPEWTKHMVIYEIAPRGFTSPNGTVRSFDLPIETKIQSDPLCAPL